MNAGAEADPEAVHPALRRAAAEAARRLEEACDETDRKDLSQESLDELLRLENELLAAARAVDETVRLRRQLGEPPSKKAEPSAPTSEEAAAGAPGPAPGCRLREFRDAVGREWRVWEVKPGSSGRRTNPERYLGEYVGGWLAFECEQEEVRKRLPNHPPDWFQMPDTDIEQMLPRAVEVRKRISKAPDAAAP